MPPKTNQISPFVQSLENSQRTEEETAFKSIRRRFSAFTEGESFRYSNNLLQKNAKKRNSIKRISIVPFEGMEM